MLDTLNFKLHHSQFDRDRLLHTFANNAKEGKATYYPLGNKAINFEYKNYVLTLGDTFLKVRGSLTKLHYGNNLQQLTYNQVLDTLRDFEHFFEISIDGADIIRVDLACNVQMDKPVSQYLDLFTSPVGYKTRTYEGETKYFEGSRDKLSFYDKKQEVRSKRNSLLGLNDKNILRYEISIEKKIAESLGWPDAKLKNLYDQEDYIAIIKKYYQAYHNIPLNTTPVISKLSFNTLAEYKESVFIEGIRNLGGVPAMITNLKQTCMDRSIRHSIKRYLESLPKGEVTSAVLKRELDEAILSVCQREIQTVLRDTIYWQD